MKLLRVILVGGARPNFMKIAPLVRAIRAHNGRNLGTIIEFKIVHTGQHYDYEMSKVFFKELEIPDPDIYLGVGSGNHGEQTGKIMIEFEKVMWNEKPDIVVVVGDVNSTLACGLVATKITYKNGKKPLIAHIEAGLRSFDRMMPEEINRILTDQISDFLFTPSQDANENLIKEGIRKEKIFFVGNIMIDNLLFNLSKAKKSSILERISLSENDKIVSQYSILTLHRPSNVDDLNSFQRIIRALKEVSQKIPIIFPAHLRTQKMINKFKLNKLFVNLNKEKMQPLNKGIYLIDPLGYLDFLNLMFHSKFVLTDSGGIQEETTFLGIPCLTLRSTTERPITISQGTNVLVHNNEQKIIKECFKILKGKNLNYKIPQAWDGKTAKRIINVISMINK
ncbi:MAG: non-hydrolyzing UDP-N-acetylglucosamine 2-epimerase [Methanosarcinales archaeon]